MLLNEPYNTVVTEAKLIFARRGKAVTRKFAQLVSKNRIVANPSQCAAPWILKRDPNEKKQEHKKVSHAKSVQYVQKVKSASFIVARLNKARG